MDRVLFIVPLVVPILGALLISNRKLIGESQITKVVAVTVILNALLAGYSIFFSPLHALHLLKVNNFLDLYIRVDQLSRMFIILASFLWVLTSFYSFGYMKNKKRLRQFYTFFTLTLAIVLGVAYSGNLFTLYVYYELLTLSTLPLVMYNGTEQALASGKKYIIYSFSGATFILFGMMLIYSVTGTMEFTPRGILTFMAFADQRILLLSYIVMFLGFGVKAALVPFHSWLPAAMVAPTPVSALLHAVAVVKSGVFSLIRMTYFIFGASAVRALEAPKYLIPFVVVTVVMGSFLALHQEHLKKRLAYSTISQLGYMLLGILMLNPNGLTGAILHMINHAVIKITLFFIVGSITLKTGKKYIHEIHGLGRQMPVSMLCFAVAAISLIGIPPTNGFVSKWFLGLGALAGSNFFYIVILLLSAFLTAGYLLPIVVAAFFSDSKKHPHDSAETSSHEESLEPERGIIIPVVGLTMLIVTLGLFPNPVINFLGLIIKDAF